MYFWVLLSIISPKKLQSLNLFALVKQIQYLRLQHVVLGVFFNKINELFAFAMVEPSAGISLRIPVHF